MASEVDKLVRKIFTLYVGYPLCLVGFVTSFLSIIVFKRDHATLATTRILLATILICDMWLLFLIVLFWTARFVAPNDSDIFRLFNDSALHTTIIFAINILDMSRNWLIVLVAIERYIFFKKPLSFKQIWTTKMVGVSVAAVFALSSVVRLPALFATLNVGNNIAAWHAHLASDFVFLSLLPISLMIMLFILTERLVRSAAKTHEDLGVATLQKETKILSILRTILIVFIVFALPALPAGLVMLYCDYNEVSESVEIAKNIFAAVADFLSIVNSTANFFVYIVQSKRYRELLREILTLKGYFKSRK